MSDFSRPVVLRKTTPPIGLSAGTRVEVISYNEDGTVLCEWRDRRFVTDPENLVELRARTTRDLKRSRQSRIDRLLGTS